MKRFQLFLRHQIRHCVTTRHLGNSPAPFNSLNLSYCVGDAPENVTKNRLSICQEFQIQPHHLYFANQVHGNHIAAIKDQTAEEIAMTQADAMVTNLSEIALGIQVADCFPVLITTQSGRIVAVAHAGRKGIETGIIPKVIDAVLANSGEAKSQVLIGVGPGISTQHYQVNNDIAERFVYHTKPNAVFKEIHGRIHLDLRSTIQNQILSKQISPDQIEHMNICTYESSNDFFSYRYSKGICGRFAAIIRCVES